MKSKKNIVIKIGTTSIIKDEELNLDLISATFFLMKSA